MTDPTSKQLEMARRIAADGYYPLREDRMLPTYARERVLSGDMDHTVQVQTVLAAIIETSERAARLSEQLATKGDAYERACGGWDDPNVEHPRSWSNVEGDGQRKVAATIRKGDHLDD